MVWPALVLAIGIIATVAANLETAMAPGWGTAVAVWPAVAYTLAASLKATRPAGADQRTAAQASEDRRDQVADMPPEQGDPSDVEPPFDGPTYIQIGHAGGITEQPAPIAAVDDVPESEPRPSRSKRAALAELVAQLPADDPRGTTELARDLAGQIGLHEGTARRYLAELSDRRATAQIGAETAQEVAP